jgi:predicted PurR-regulated permease PerM
MRSWRTTVEDGVTRRTFRVLVGSISAMLLLLFLYSIAEILLLLFLAVLGSLYLGAITDRLQHWLGLPRRLGLLGALLSTLLILAGTGYLILPPVARQVQELWLTLPAQLELWDAQLFQRTQHSPVAAHLLGHMRNGESYLGAFLPEIGRYFRGAVPYVFGGVRLLILTISVVTMGIYLALRPALYREGMIALIPPVHRDLARNLLADRSRSLRAWIVGQIIMMSSLGFFTWIGLQLLGVPYALAFGVFTGIVAIVPVFGTLISIILPALFIFGSASFAKILAVLALGIGVHILETNIVSPMIMEHQVHLPPVLTLLSVLIMAHLLGVVGLLVAVPTLASIMVILKWLYLHRVLEGKGFRRAIRDHPVEVQLPSDGVLVHPIARGVSLPTLLE